MCEELKRIEVTTTSGVVDIFEGEAARKVESALDHAMRSQASRTTPVEIYPNETIEFNYYAVIKIARFYGTIQEPTEEDPTDED